MKPSFPCYIDQFGLCPKCKGVAEAERVRRPTLKAAIRDRGGGTQHTMPFPVICRGNSRRTELRLSINAATPFGAPGAESLLAERTANAGACPCAARYEASESGRGEA